MEVLALSLFIAQNLKLVALLSNKKVTRMKLWSRILYLLIFICVTGSVYGQTLESLSLLRDSTRRDTASLKTSSSVPAGNDQLSAPRNYYNLLRNKSITRKGLFTVHKVQDNYYFEIPDSLLGRDM